MHMLTLEGEIGGSGSVILPTKARPSPHWNDRSSAPTGRWVPSIYCYRSSAPTGQMSASCGLERNPQIQTSANAAHWNDRSSAPTGRRVYSTSFSRSSAPTGQRRALYGSERNPLIQSTANAAHCHINHIGTFILCLLRFRQFLPNKPQPTSTH